MRLLFIYTAERVARDSRGNYYSSGNFSEEVWSRYYSLCDDFHAIMREGEILKEEEVKNQSGYSLLNTSKVIMHLVPDRFKQAKNYISFKLRRKEHEIYSEEIWKSDLVIVRSADVVPIELCKKYNKPYAVEVVGCPWDSLWNHSLKGKILAPIVFLCSKYIIRQAKYVLYVTNEFLQRRYPTNGKTVGCSNVSIHIAEMTVLAERLEHIKIHEGKIVLGTAAALYVRYKGQEYVIRALAELKKRGYTNFEYQVAGGGSSEYLLETARRYDVIDQFKVIGRLTHDEVLEWLKGVDVYIQPSLQEGLPRAVIEAMSRAVPCIGTAIAGIPELLDKEMLFSRKDYIEIANILEKLSLEDFERYAKRNYEKAKEYDVDVLGKRRKDFYMEFIKENYNDQ